MRKSFIKALAVRLSILTALSLICLWLYSDFLVARIEARYPPAGDILAFPETQLHMFEQGQGPAIVLLHGASANLRDMATSLMPGLSRSFRVIAVDRPGHGYSTLKQSEWLTPADQANLIVQALKAKGVDRAIWVGHSWAGSVVMAGLLNHPDAVSEGVLLGAAIYPWKGGVDWLHHLPDVPLIGPLFIHSLLPIIGGYQMPDGIAGAFKPNPVSKDYQRNTGVELYLRPDQFAANGRDLRFLSDFLDNQSQRYSEITQDILILHGEADDTVPAWNHAHRLVEILPQVQLAELPGIGHLPHHSATSEVVSAIMDFASPEPTPTVQFNSGTDQQIIDYLWTLNEGEITAWLAQGGNPNRPLDRSGSTAFHVLVNTDACQIGSGTLPDRFSSIASLLVAHDADVNAVDSFGNPILHLAMNCSDRVVRELLAAGADFQQTNARGLSAFELTVEQAAPAGWLLIDAGYRLNSEQAKRYRQVYAEEADSLELIRAASP